ncbi:hypothetical protein EW146_g794 [Bondarzewia mesenterica]|uniref:C3H1-type domain-containing protein n=1 Tax=Bondarzewia mesenterica TaxID=1095465 RepID=A0A4S4M5T7_9AGAM|nr:hypothetical protein EW146_g794 [Bondarzewia mesenterica]
MTMDHNLDGTQQCIIANGITSRLLDSPYKPSLLSYMRQLNLFHLIFLLLVGSAHANALNWLRNATTSVQTDRGWLWGWAWGADSIVSVVDRSPPLTFLSRPAAFGAELTDPLLGYVIPLNSFTAPCPGSGNDDGFSRFSDSSLSLPLNRGCPELCVVGPNAPESSETWIALVQRGKCQFVDKAREAQRLGARAVVVGGDDPEESGNPDALVNMYSPGDASDVKLAATFIKYSDYVELYSLIESSNTSHSGLKTLSLLLSSEYSAWQWYSPILTFLTILIIPCSLTFLTLLVHRIRLARAAQRDRAPEDIVKNLPWRVWTGNGWEKHEGVIPGRPHHHPLPPRDADLELGESPAEAPSAIHVDDDEDDPAWFQSQVECAICLEEYVKGDRCPVCKADVTHPHPIPPPHTIPLSTEHASDAPQSSSPAESPPEATERTPLLHDSASSYTRATRSSMWTMWPWYFFLSAFFLQSWVSWNFQKFSPKVQIQDERTVHRHHLFYAPVLSSPFAYCDDLKARGETEWKQDTADPSIVSVGTFLPYLDLLSSPNGFATCHGPALVVKALLVRVNGLMQVLPERKQLEVSGLRGVWDEMRKCRAHRDYRDLTFASRIVTPVGSRRGVRQGKCFKMRKHQQQSLDERRHTKPCRFFQKGTCPLSSEHCQFAHVKESDPIKTPRGPIQMCKYRLAGGCGEGDRCRYKHTFPDPMQDPYSPACFQTPFPRTPSYRASVPHPYSPSFYPPAPAPSPVSASFRKVSVLDSDTELDGDIPCLGSASSPSVQSSSLADVDADSPDSPLDDTYSYSNMQKSGSPGTGHFYGTPWSPEGVFCNPFSPGIYGSPTTYVPFSPVSFGGYFGPLSPVPGFRPLQFKRKAKAYKTKHCKFFRKDGQCPKGEKCTFVHDLASVRPPATPSSSQFTQKSPITPSSQSDSLRYKLPNKPVRWASWIGADWTLGFEQEKFVRISRLDNAPTETTADSCIPKQAYPLIDVSAEDDLLSPIPEERYSAEFLDATTPRGPSFLHEDSCSTPRENKTGKVKRGSVLSITIPEPPQYLPDLPSFIIPGERTEVAEETEDRDGNDEEGLLSLARPHSTPPRLWNSKAPNRITVFFFAESPFP